MTTMFALEPVDLGQAAELEFHVHHQLSVRAEATRVFTVLSTGERQTDWARDYKATSWYGKQIAVVGAVRDIHLRWITTRERFLAWDPGLRFAFCADAMSLPLARSMIEDIQITPTTTADAPASCRLDWYVAYTPARLLRPVGQLLHRRVISPMFYDFAVGLAAYVERYPDGYQQSVGT